VTRRRPAVCGLLVLLTTGCLTTACASRSGPQAAGFAYTAPETLNLRQELGLQAPTTATLTHGERVEIMETRRRFVRVRTANGATGWTDSAYLLTQAQIDDLNALAKRASEMPSQGAATVYDTLNVHTAPSRTAPNLLQLKEGAAFDVVSHQITPRTPSEPRGNSVVFAGEPRESAPKKNASKQSALPQAAPPALPENWEQLSHPRMADLTPSSPGSAPPADDWFLVRTKDGRAGWVLMRAVMMKVPDEVAQYAERQLVTSYHALGETRNSKGQLRNHWLWTPLARGGQGYDFDSFRVFIYSTRRDRYETVAIDRNVRGHFPVETTAAPDGVIFSFLTEEKDGSLNKRTYLFKDLHARLVSKDPANLPAPLPEVRPAKAFDAIQTEEDGWFRRMAKKWFGQ